MEIITGNEHDLMQLIEGAYKRLDQTRDNLERYVLIDYLYQLHEAYRSMTGKKSYLNEKRAFRSKSQARKYTQYLDSLFFRLEDEFIKYKEYHRDLFDVMLSVNDEVLDGLEDTVFSSGYQTMSKEEFCEYFFEFLREYGLEDMFDKFISGRKIFNRPLNENEKYAGTVLHDPRKKRSSIMLCDFEYTVPYMLTLGHEFGHTFDLNKLNKKDSDTYMKYSYSSVYGETIAIVFEKLFYDFLFRKKYRLDDLKEIYAEFSFEGKNYVLDAYLLSLLDDKAIRNLKFDSVSDDEILGQVSSYFTRHDELLDHLDGRSLDTWKTPLYAYGDYFSTILKDSVHKEGLDSRLMRRFFEYRTKEFNPEDLGYHGFDMETYQRVYKRDVSRLKK